MRKKIFVDEDRNEFTKWKDYNHNKNKRNNYNNNQKDLYYEDPINNASLYKYNDIKQKRHFKESYNNDYLNYTQIMTIPGGIKGNKYEIQDNYYFRKQYNYSRLYKLVYDFNSNINYEDNYFPITQGYNINSFPIKQRYYGSYKRGIQDHDIFCTKFFNKNKYLYDLYN